MMESDDAKNLQHIREVLRKIPDSIEEIEDYELDITTVDGRYKTIVGQPATVKRKVTLKLVFYTREFTNPKLRKRGE